MTWMGQNLLEGPLTSFLGRKLSDLFAIPTTPLESIFSSNLFFSDRSKVESLLYYKLNCIMEATKGQSNTAHAPTTPSTSCRRKKNEDATFLEDLKDHIDEFIHASMDEHKSCFKKTIEKMFSMSKVVAERNSSTTKEGVESSLPLKTTLSE